MSAHLDAISERAIRPAPSNRYLVTGASPLRVLLVGNGIALGFGVDSKADTLDGRLGEGLAERTGRGVVVSNWTQDSSRLDHQAMSIVAGMTMETEDVVIWCPSYHELLERPSPLHWRSAIGMIIDHIAPSVAIVVNLIPVIESDDLEVASINASIERINNAMRQRVDGTENVIVCEPAPVRFALDSDLLYDAAYYADLGSQIVDLVLRLRPWLHQDRRPNFAFDSGS